MPAPTFYEFFAGGGMARAGLGAGWRCLFANDVDPRKAAAYAENWGAEALRVGDVAGLTVADLPGRADLVWASFPCQDLSLAGAGAGLGGARSGTFWPFWRLMRELGEAGRKPRAVVLENVLGLLSSYEGADFAALCAVVAGAGYRVGALVIDAALFVPQSRPRLFVVAIDDALPIPNAVVAAQAVDRWHPERLRAAEAALAEATRARWLWVAPPAPPARDTNLADLIENAPADPPWHDPSQTARLVAMMNPVNRAKLDLVAANRRLAVGALYRRTRVEHGVKRQRAEVRFDMAGCLRTPAGGSSRQTIVVAEDGRVRTRLISARETARLMGLPDDYRLPPRYADACRLTGDGVVAPVVRHLAAHVIEPALAAFGGVAAAA